MKLGDRHYLTRESFQKIFSGIEALGYEQVSREEVLREIQKKGSLPYLQKKFKGMEKGYVYRYKRWKVFLWTTYVPAIDDINEQDLIWIGITDERSPIVFFWFPIKRTLNFVSTTISHAAMCIEFVQKWPTCTQCGEPLFLVFVKGIMNLMKFVCGNDKFVHTIAVREFYPVFDIPLSDEHGALLYDGFKRNLEYQHANDVKRTPHKSARLDRAQRKKDAIKAHNEKYNQYGDIKSYRDDRYDD